MITIHLLTLTAVLAAAAVFGFFAARIWLPGEKNESDEDDIAKVKERKVEKNGKGWSVGSPVSGQMTVLQEGQSAAIAILPVEDKLFAPAAGKIIKLYPLGNVFQLRTEFGTELCIQAGKVQDELLGRYFRPRILQNEIVSKGKLLLEFDRQGLEAEGASTEVSVRIDSCSYGSDVITGAEGQIKAGEEIFWIQEETEDVESRRGLRSMSNGAY